MLPDIGRSAKWRRVPPRELAWNAPVPQSTATDDADIRAWRGPATPEGGRSGHARVGCPRPMWSRPHPREDSGRRRPQPLQTGGDGSRRLGLTGTHAGRPRLLPTACSRSRAGRSDDLLLPLPLGLHGPRTSPGETDATYRTARLLRGLNIGDEAILTSMLAGLREAMPFAEVVIFSRDAAHTRDTHPVDRVLDARRGRCDAVTEEIAKLDVLVLGGGGLLYDSEATEYLGTCGPRTGRGYPPSPMPSGPGRSPPPRTAAW